MKNLKKLAAVGLVFALLSGCGRTASDNTPPPSAAASANQTEATLSPDAVPSEAAPSLSPEELAVQEAGKALEGFRWPREVIQKSILGQDMEFFLYHGNGWTIHVPSHWTENSHGSQ